jgi:superfamily II DNA or RNA helicase
MTLRDLRLDARDGRFDSDKENLLESFYVPCLKESTSYRRMAGYFCSNALALAAPGIEGLLRNHGTIQIIANVVLSREDQDDIQRALRSHEDRVIHEVSNLVDDLETSHISILAYLLKTRRLEIKIAVVDGGLEHSKWGIFEDSEGNRVVFSGSDNETVNGWLEHHERFEVHLSWLSDDLRRFVQPTLEDWDRFWSEGGKRVRVYPVSEAFERNLIRTAPRDDVEFATLTSKAASVLRERIEARYLADSARVAPRLLDLQDLRDYQQSAIHHWEDNHRRGILRMATGTGKTRVAIVALTRMLKEGKDPIFIVIAVPTQLLVSQWSDMLHQAGLGRPVEVMGSKTEWLPKVRENVLKVKLGTRNHVVVVATYASFCSPDFIRAVLDSGFSHSLIADEMHHAWAPKTRTGLLDSYQTRLGLSATPEIYMDDEGTKQLHDYFGGIQFTFDIEQAIPKYLTEYDYHAEVVHLTADELARYEDLSRKIAGAISSNHGSVDEKAFALILLRAKIITNADGKWAAFERILTNIGQMRRTLIYCSDKQIDRVKQFLRTRGIKAHQLTYEESLAYRDEIISHFKSDRYQAIVAMKVLDEGIDVPAVQQAIILSSSGNSIEYVQRRGRVLRKADEKDYSVIYDVLVFPWESSPSDLGPSTMTALRRELNRVKEFAKTSRNPLEVLSKVAPLEGMLAE